eukprot:gene16058-17681_t
MNLILLDLMLVFTFVRVSKGNESQSKMLAVFVEDRIFAEVEKDISLRNNTNSNVIKVLPVHSNAGLSRFVNITQRAMTNISQPGMIISFLNEDLQEILKLTAGHASSLSFSAKYCQMSLQDENVIFSITNHPQGYQTAAKAVVDYFQLKKVAIIAANDSGRRRLAKEIFHQIEALQKRTLDDTHHHNQLFKYEFNNDVMSTKKLSSIMFETAYLDVTAIVLICPNDVVETVFKVAMKYSLLGYNRVWVTFDHEVTTGNNLKAMPLQLVNIAQTRMTDAKWNANEVANLSLSTVEIFKENRHAQGSIFFTALSSMFTSKKCTKVTQEKTVQVLYRQNTGEWVEIFRWKQTLGITLSNKNTELHKLFRPPMAERQVNVVTILDEPFTAKAHHYYVTDSNQNNPCEKGLFCKIPHVTRGGNKTVWNSTCCIGHSMELLRWLATDLYFTPNVYIVEDGFYGSKVNGKWNGMIRDLQLKKADMSISGMTINNVRLTAVDFTASFAQVKAGIIISTHNKQLNVLNFSFLSYISGTLYWCLLGAFIGGLVLVYSFENEKSICCGRQSSEDDTGRLSRKRRHHNSYTWKDSFTYFSGLTFQRDLGGKSPTQYGARLTAVVFAFSMVITMTAYTAVLTASQVIQEERNPFLGIKDERMTNPTPEFKFASVKETATEAFFRGNSDPTLRRMYLFMKNYGTKTTADGIENVRTGKIQGFISDKAFLQYYVMKQRKCVLQIVDLPFDHISYGIALQKGSRWKSLLSNAIRKYKDNGDMLRLDKKWLSGACSSGNKTLQSKSYSAQHFSGLFVILLAASAFVLLILGCEHAYYRLDYRGATAYTEKSVVQLTGVTRKSDEAKVDDPIDVEVTLDWISKASNHVKTE